MRLRQADPADLPALTRLEQETLENPWTTEQLAEELARPDSRCLVAEEGGAVTGYALARLAAGVLELLRIGVSPAHRRRGVGGALLTAVVEAARHGGAEEIWLEVRAGNRAAIALYERGGFSRVGLRPRYYDHPPEDALLFQRTP